MKFLFGILMLLTLAAAAARAQDSKALAKITEITAKQVKDAPFSAEAVSESVQVLADGNKITRSTTIRMFRDGAGRFRREEMQKPIGIPGSSVELPRTIVILDPVAGVQFHLDPASKTARQVGYKALDAKTLNDFNKNIKEFEKQRQAIEKRASEVKKQLAENKKWLAENNKRIAEAKEQIAEAKERVAAVKDKIAAAQSKVDEKVATKIQAEVEAKKQIKGAAKKAEIESKTAAKQSAKTSTESEKAEVKAKVVAEQSGKARAEAEQSEKARAILSGGDAKTESLGTRKIEGLDAEGTRSTKTIPAGAIGNERAIDIVYERWYSKDLQLVVFSRHSDPRFGEQTYRLINVKRSEPDGALFSIPPDYTIVNQQKPRAEPRPARPARPKEPTGKPQ